MISVESMSVRSGRWLLTELFSLYCRMAELRLAKRDDDIFRRNIAGLDDAISLVRELPDDDARLLALDAWVDEAGIDEWHSSLSDGGWWSDLYYRCTRFRAFGDDDVDDLVSWVVSFYIQLPQTITDAPMTSTPMKVETARDALYVDFEGRMEEPPLLLGLLLPGGTGEEDRFVQLVFDPLFAEAASAKGATISTVDHALRVLDSYARRGSAIVAWSGRERTAIVEAGGESAKRVQSRYRDARELARHWRRTVRPDLEPPKVPGRGRHTLAFYLGAIGYAVPKSHGPGNTGARIQAVRTALERTEGSYEQLTPVQKSKWTNLLQHNRHDCEGMKAFCLKAAADLEATL
jgi:hypothetical protein